MMKRNWSIATRVLMIAGLVVAGAPLATSTVAQALPNTNAPVLSLNRTIRTTPFVGTSSSTRDGEGSAFVANDPAHPNIGGTDSLWLAEDNGRAVWEINPYTGALKSSIQDSTWQATKQYSSSTGTGSGSSAGSNRDPDLESLAYDKTNDTLYAFSGKCCTSSVLPTSYRLKRGVGSTFHPEAWQALPSGSDYTASAWHPGDHKVYVGVGSAIRTYDFPTNASGSTFSVSGVSGIYGMSFSDDGNDLFVAEKSVKIVRANWNTKTAMPGWTFTLTSFGMKDSRAIEVINDQFYVYDGYDGRSTSDPLRYAVFVFDVCCGAGNPPVASFSSTQTASPNFTVQFTDTSSNAPNAWAWDFDNNGTTDSTAQNPLFSFPGAGDFTVKHTASNRGGTSPAVSQVVHVAAPGPAAAAFTSAAAASPPHAINFTDTSTGGATGWAWDFDNNGTTDSTAQNPLFSFSGAGDFTVKHTAANRGGTSPAVSQVVHVAAPGPATAAFTSAAAASPPHAIKFTDTSTGGATGWAWDFDNNATTDSTAQNPSFTFAAAGSFPVTLTVDNGFGSASVTKTVVVVDQPTVTTLNPVADAYVSKSSPTKNYATYTDLKALAFNGTYEYHPYFQFTVTGLTGAPASAKLRLYVTDGGPTGGDWFNPLGAWTETGLTWNNAPALTGSPFVTVGTVTPGQWVEIDVTAKVAADGTYTFAATNSSTDIVTYASKESAFAPQLVITR